MRKHWIAGAIGAAAFAGAAFGLYAWHPAIAPITPPAPSSFSADSVQHGALVADAGFCAACHTRRNAFGAVDGPVMAGDFAMPTPFGTFYSSNLTPDPETGIGTWSEAAFKRAMREGIAQNGEQLFPVFPFDHFTHLTDQDISDLYAWLMSQPAVRMQPRADKLPFPVNLRFLQAGWKLLFLHKGPLPEDPTQSAEWNRGHYIAESASHCGSCHTPRNLLGGEKLNHSYDGAVLGAWIAPAINEHSVAPMPWTQQDLTSFLTTGVSLDHGVSVGPMAQIPHEFYNKLPPKDVEAVATYFASKTMVGRTPEKTQAAYNFAMQASGKDMSGPWQGNEAAEDTLVTCGTCHATMGSKPVPGRPNLALSTALWLDEPTNFFHIVLGGINAQSGKTGVVMPSFYQALSDAELARIAAYLRKTRTTAPPWTDLEKKAAAVRATLNPPPLALAR